MSIREQLAEDVKQAMKSGDRPRLGALRMLRSRIQEREVALRAERGRDYELTDDEAVEVLATYAKQRRESIDSYRRGGRDDLVAREEAELAVVESYLPRPLEDDEIRALAREAVAEAGASGPRDLGTVMKLVMPRVRGRADGRRVGEIVRELLG